MTEEEQIKHYGEKLDPKYAGFVEGRDPVWTREHYIKALEIARKYDMDIIFENDKQSNDLV